MNGISVRLTEIQKKNCERALSARFFASIGWSGMESKRPKPGSEALSLVQDEMVKSSRTYICSVDGIYRMEELIKRLSGKKIDVSCGVGAVLRGEVIDVKDGVLYLRDEDDKSAYISIDKIASVYECSDSASRPGFVG